MKINRRGFTLVEVLVAMIILGLSIGAVFQALSVSRRIAQKADETLTEERLAQNLLADPLLIGAALTQKESSGNIDLEPSWRYSMTAQPLELSTGDDRNALQVPGVYELNLCLYHETMDREKIFCMKQWYRQQG